MAQGNSIKILSNFQRFPPVLQRFSSKKRTQISFEPLPSNAQKFRTLRTFLKAFKKELLILNIEEGLLYKLCFLKYLCPWNRCLIISVDILLQPPINTWDRIICRIKGWLLKNVDCFILYFKDVSGYQKYYKLHLEKCVYVSFKVNQFDKIQTHLAQQPDDQNQSDGDCVMAIGRSLRDLNTFINAMAQTKLPGVILRQSDSLMALHGTVIGNEKLPSNLKEVEHDRMQYSFIQHISKAKIVVIPRFRWDIKSTGISTYLMAMAMKKCVIISHGPGTTELLQHDEAILVQPEDVNSLSEAISKAWHQTAYRKQIANNGQKYAFSLKDEKRLLWDIVNFSYKLYMQKL